MRAILTYHSIDDSGSAVSVSREAFARQVSWLANRGVAVVSLHKLLSLPDDIDAVALTFDDGFRNFEEEAWPLLDAHGFAVTMFVVADHAGRRNDWNGQAEPGIPNLPLLDWDALARLHEHGVELGAHTCSHPDLTALPLPDAVQEIEQSMAALASRVGVRPRAFAYPYGLVTRPLADAVARQFDLAVTTELKWLDPDDSPWLLPRLDMYYFQFPGALDDWGRAPFRARVRARRALRTVRGTMMRAARVLS